MRNLLILFLFVFTTCCQSRHTSASIISSKEVGYKYVYDSTFEYHFHILDSVRNSNPLDSIYTCCSPTIKFMEDRTGIESATDGTFIGKIKFTKYDLIKWHEWYSDHIKK